MSLPLIRPLAIDDPLRALEVLASLPRPFLLHSALEGERSRWSFFGADPFASFAGGDAADAHAAFRALAARADAHSTLVPFTGGAVGYWAYDYGRRLERLPEIARDDLNLPDFALAFYDVVGAFDHATREACLFSSGLPFDGPARERHAEQRLESFAAAIETRGGEASDPDALKREWGGDASGSLASPPHVLTAPLLESTFSPEAYRRAVETVREHIRRGDIFQANLSQRWTLGLPPAGPGPRARRLFRFLAAHSPAPFAAYLDLGDHAIASASPERFLELRGRRVETRPIKGTRPRGEDAAEDARFGAELLASEKDRAENVMIVDVLRNDIGRVCESGTVETIELCALESFPQVHHLVSTVTGRLRAGLGAFELLDACFPGGSITGAPKIRAMEILDGLEPVRRHAYTGAIGYVSWQGDADWSIAIRTALVTPDAIHFAAGGGITADSDAEAEYEETLHKAAGIASALETAFGAAPLSPARAHAR
jgi:para-aminobenzoate synthetase component 1